MSRKERLANVDPFGAASQPETGSVSFEEADQSLFGKIAEVDASRQIVKPIRIMDIYPDVTQARRAMPSAVRREWSGQPETLEKLLGGWYQKAVEESGHEFDLGRSLMLEDEASVRTDAGPLEAALVEVVALAASIRRDGLTNPITVARAGRHYRLETGERRWLAFHLLHTYFDGREGKPDERERWSRIPAREVASVSVWRQATENTARADLNAIGRARQFAILLMDLLLEENERLAAHEQVHLEQFSKVAEEGGSERAYYAQVADAKRFRVPSGKNQVLMSAMGLKNRSQLSHYRAILALPDEVWQIGDDYSLPDEVLYRLASINAEQAIEEAHKIVVGHNNLGRPRAVARMPIDHTPGTKRHFAELVRAVNHAGPRKTANNERALQHIEQLEVWLAEQKQRIQKYQ